ncbi:hypothetical protein [Legionella sp. km772]|uniref:hypothetical protein n=1 Tax=Legionella sp. km772 TaxID=2498111 RepID=UPI000F8EDE95|nr:hypothetical protein [Legionella sp. km772]RUR10398.1 hypothetical protein ELY15_08160 [Legionella sp. km772]
MSNLGHTEYRFSTQAQRHQGEVRVSPLFKRWLAISAKRTPATQLINHIYFNNLGLDRDQFDLPGANEKELTRALHQLEGESTLKTVVITLPASQGLMNAEEYKMIIGDLPYSKVFRELFTLANSEHHPSGVVDFKISPKVRTLLFGNESNQAQEIKKLLTNSFLSMGLKPGDYLSPAKRQSVWLHFTKFELTRYIINKLKPNSYNFSCKDAIDRGTVSSLYFNLHQSFNFGQPISKDEFERDLDIAAANVKGRGMNFHRRILWNAIDCFVNANYQDLIQDQRKSWLIYWRDMNCPHSRVSHLLHLRLQQYEQQLKKLSKTQINTDGHQLLATAKQLYEQKVNGQRLLLEVISRSSQFLSEKPTMASINAYKNLAQELKVNHPLLQILAGLMLGFLGVILFSFSLVEQAQAKINTGFFVADRDRLRSYIVTIAEKEEANISAGLSPLSPDVNSITI